MKRSNIILIAVAAVATVAASVGASYGVAKAVVNGYKVVAVDGKDGRDGVNGQDGAAGKDGIDGRDGRDGLNGRDGVNGQDGADGQDGNSVVSIEKTNTDGLIDTYTITYSDGTTSTFTVTNGANGADGRDGINGTNGVDGKDGANGRDGKDGLNGKDGKDGKDGVDGKDGSVITIGGNGHWFIDGVDTGIKAGDKDEPKDNTGADKLAKRTQVTDNETVYTPADIFPNIKAYRRLNDSIKPTFDNIWISGFIGGWDDNTLYISTESYSQAAYAQQHTTRYIALTTSYRYAADLGIEMGQSIEVISNSVKADFNATDKLTYMYGKLDTTIMVDDDYVDYTAYTTRAHGTFEFK